MENVLEFLGDLSVLSSTGLIGSLFTFLDASSDWLAQLLTSSVWLAN